MSPTPITLNVMAPLLVGEPGNPVSAASREAWSKFESYLSELKALGVHGVSTDVWWGLVEPQEGVFDWTYYDRISDMVIAAGLRWIPILSFHQCGGNIGDDKYVALPFWVWTKLAKLVSSGSEDGVKFLSEQGNLSHEYVSYWATNLVLENYRAVMLAFQKHFACKAEHVAEINVSLGPAGELRYPSYNCHDEGAGYPTRGALQAYSELAVESFGRFLRGKYRDMSGLNDAWGVPLGENHVIGPPFDVEAFFRDRGHLNTQFGRDFFDWYQHSLINHGRQMLTAAIEVFAADDAPFAGIDIGAKIAGVHWRLGRHTDHGIELGDRLAELSAGLIRTSANDWESDEDGRGYRPLLSLFSELQKLTTNSRLVLHFTCLEMADGQDGPEALSLPYTLSRWVLNETLKLSLTLKGENALSFTLFDRKAWKRLRQTLPLAADQVDAYRGLTLLRMGAILGNHTAKDELKALAQAVNNAAA